MEGKLQLAETKGQHCPRSASTRQYGQQTREKKYTIRDCSSRFSSHPVRRRNAWPMLLLLLVRLSHGRNRLLAKPKESLGGESLSWGISREERGVSRLLLLLLWLWRRSNLHVDRIARRSEAVYCTQAGSVTTNRERGKKKTGQMRCEKCLLSLKFSSLIR